MKKLLSYVLAYLSDLGTASLVSQKLFSASLILSPTSFIFWYSLPALLLVDIPLVGLLQFAPCLIFPSEQSQNNGYISKSPFKMSPGPFWRLRFPHFTSRSPDTQDTPWIPLAQNDPESRPSRSSTNSADVPLNDEQALQPGLQLGPSDYEDADFEFLEPQLQSRSRVLRALQGFADFCTIKFCLLLMLYLVLVFINITLFFLSLATIGPYKVHEIVWSWDEALANMSNASELAFLATRSAYVPTFLLVTGFLILAGFAVTLVRVVISHYFSPSWKVIAAALGIYVLVAVLLRPPPSVVATNILLDGFMAFLRRYRHKVLQQQPTAASSLGYISDNHNATTLFDLGRGAGQRGSKGYDHMMFVFLESADKMAWPFTRKFCQERNCMDLDPSLNATHFTPFFLNLTRASLDVPLFKTNVPFTIKSHWSTLCGQMHKATDMASEFRHPWPFPCLPKLLKQLDDNFTSAFIEPSTTEWDNQNVMLEHEGFDFIWNKEKMDKEYGGEREMTNYWGYADHQAHPAIFKWIDEQITNDNRMLLVHSTTTMHDPFSLPPGFHANHYTNTERVNGYLNVIKYTDHYLQVLLDGLEERGILDKTLVVIQGDHGPRINWHGDNQDDDSAISHPTPLIISTPYTRQRYHEGRSIGLPPLSTDVKWTSIDILPTVLDVMGMNSTIWNNYMGQSILKERKRVPNRTFHTCAPGGRGPQIHEGHRKVVRKWNGDLCGFDLDRDPKEWYGWCLNSPYTNDRGWMEAKEPDSDSFRSGEDDWPDEEDKLEFQRWTKDASQELLKFININEAWWDGGEKVNKVHRATREDFEQLIEQSKQKGELWTA